MALFKKTTAKAESKKTTEKKVATKKKEEVVVAEVVSKEATLSVGKGLTLEQVLIRPRVTEKASDLSEKGVYAFEINLRAGKAEVRRAIEQYFKVKPARIAIVVGKPKYARNPRTNRVQVKKAILKKALVYLKKGDKIEFV
jgi:large subunit ribosomal protein L23